MSMFISGSGPESESFVILGSSPPMSELSHHPTSINELNDKRESYTSVKPTPSPNRSIIDQPASIQKRSGDFSQDYAQDFLMGKLSAQQLESFTNVEDLEKIEESKKVQETIMGLINTIKTNNIFMRQHYSRIQKYQNDVAVLHKEHEEQLGKRDVAYGLVIKENQTLKEEIEKLTNELNANKDLQMLVNNLTKTLDEHKKHITTLTIENNQLKKDVIDVNTNFNVNYNFVENEKIELQKNISEKLSVIQNMSAEIEKLRLNSKGSLSDAISLSEHRNQMGKLENRISSLVSQNMEILSMKTKFEEEINCREVFLTKLKEDIKLMKIALERKDIQLEMELASKTTLQSSIEVLNIQLETFRGDFEIERQGRQTLAGEKEQLLTELKLVQRRNQQLTDEISKMGTGASGSTSTTQNKPQDKSSLNKNSNTPNSSDIYNRRERESSSREREYERPTYICPLCSAVFSTMKNLEYHVDSCLEN